MFHSEISLFIYFSYILQIHESLKSLLDKEQVNKIDKKQIFQLDVSEHSSKTDHRLIML